MNSKIEKKRSRRGWLWGTGSAVIAAALLIFFMRTTLYPYSVGPKQPLPFSHRIHAGVRQISCLFCHDSADRSPNAGMPALEKCLLCHNVIAAKFDPIRKLHQYYDDKRPVRWVRVYQLPDYVHFTHEMHLAAGIDCSKCHGDVKGMDRIAAWEPIYMGFCIDCHRKNGATVDCLYCHY